MNKKLRAIATGVCFLTGCDQGSAAADSQAAKSLADKSVANMVSVKGSDFLMGDFGPLVEEKLPFSIQQDDKVLHKVTFSSFRISKYKVTNVDFKTFLDVTDKTHPLQMLLLRILLHF